MQKINWCILCQSGESTKGNPFGYQGVNFHRKVAAKEREQQAKDFKQAKDAKSKADAEWKVTDKTEIRTLERKVEAYSNSN